MNSSLRQGMFFGANSGIITTVGLITGLVQTKISKNYLIISIISLAIADSISEAYGMYISKKAENTEDDSQNPFFALIGLLIMKFLIVISFLIPFAFSDSLKYYKNLYWIVGWSLFLISLVDYNISELRDESLLGYLIPHTMILFLVIYLTQFFGRLIETYN
jgi:vacuolar iron transporter family protein